MPEQNFPPVQRVQRPAGDDHDRIVRTLAAAFETDPVSNWMLRKDDRRLEGFHLLFRTCLTLGLQKGEVFQSPHCEGSALWYTNGNWKISYVRQAGFVPEMLRALGLRGVIPFIKALNVMEKNHPHEPHYYLQILGVHPQHQGKGIGAALLKPVLERCDRAGTGAYLENSNPKNLDFYSRHGFRVTREIRLGKGSPPMWLMWRDPR